MARTIQSFETIRTRLDDVRRRIAMSARRCRREPEEITLLAVTKTHPVQIIQQAIEAGVTDLGENRVQEAEEKIEQLGSVNVRWNLIGHLQSNKARSDVKLFDMIHSADSVVLAKRVDHICTEENRE